MSNPQEDREKCEFPEGKESYCPRCYFEDEKTILRKDCPHNKSSHPQDDFEKEWKEIINPKIFRCNSCGLSYPDYCKCESPVVDIKERVKVFRSKWQEEARNDARQKTLEECMEMIKEMIGDWHKRGGRDVGYYNALQDLLSSLQTKVEKDKEE